MKVKRFQKKLVLNKKTIANLEDREMKRVIGGEHPPTGSIGEICCYTTSVVICCE